MSGADISKESQLRRYRSLVMFLATSDLKLRYRNSILGFLWSFLEPLLMLGVMYFVFSYIYPSQNIKNFPLYLLLGIVMWNTYTRSTQTSLNSMVAKKGIVSKIYFPREILPLSSCIMSFIMLLFELIAFGIFMAVFNFIPPFTIVFLPLLIIILFALSLGVSFFLAVANVYFRDIQYIWAVLIHASFFIVPIFYDIQAMPESLRNLVLLNPMAALLDLGHKTVLYGILPALSEILYPVAVSSITLVIGYFIFRKFEAKAVELL